MRNEALEEFQDKLIKDAIKQVDKDKLANTLKLKIEEKIESELDSFIENGLDLEYWLTNELTDPSTSAGKEFNKALKGIAKRMAASI